MKTYSNYKDSSIEWLGQIPEHWGVKKLFWLSDMTSGTTPEANYDKYYNNGEYNWVNTGDLNDDKLLGTSKFVTGVALVDYSALKIVKPNTVIIAMYGATIGKLSILKISAVANQACCCISAHEDKLNYNYLFYYLLSNREHIINMSYGAGQPNISQDIMKNFYLSYPSLPEQQQIAEYLDLQTAKIDELVQKQNKLIETLQEKKKSLINHVVTKGLDPDVQMKDSGVEWLGQIPEPWKMKKLKYLAAVRDIKQQYITGYDYIGLENIESWTGKQVLSKEEQHIDGLANLCFSGDVLFGKLRPYLAKCTIANKQSLCSTEILVLNSIKMSNKLLQYHMLSENFINDVNGSTYGTKMPRANWEYLSNLKLPLPPSNEQQQIAEYLDQQTTKIDTLINKAKSMVELLKAHKQSLINSVVTGKIKVIDEDGVA